MNTINNFVTDIKDSEYCINTRFFSDSIVRITYGKKSETETDKDSAIIVSSCPENMDITSEYSEKKELILKSEKLTVKVNSFGVEFSDNEGNLLSKANRFSLTPYDIKRKTGGDIRVRETVDGIRATLDGGDEEYVRTSYHGDMTFDFVERENLYGLGSHEEGYANLKGEFVPLYQENMRIAIPVFVSSKGYGVLIDCTSYMTFDCKDYRHGRFWLDSVDKIDFWFIYGEDYIGVWKGIKDLTGTSPMLPKWACGYIQSKERYCTQDELIEIAREYRNKEIPIDVIVQDWLYWRDGAWGDKHFDSRRYPDPKKLTDTLHEMDFRLLVSIWPNLTWGTDDHTEMLENGLLLSDNSTANAFDEKGREMYWKHANEGLFKYGIDGWWCDSSEPFDAVWGGAQRPPLPERMKKSTDEAKKYIDDSMINVYSLFHTRGMYENQRKCSDKRIVNLTRSGYSGEHRYSAVVWSGDTSANWETLRKQVKIQQNYIVTGEPWWNCDIGAFFVDGGYEWFRDGEYPEGCNDDKYRELYTRWLQFSVFTPMMRSHGTNTPREVWRFGERGSKYRDAIEKAIKIRYALMPYLYSVHSDVTFEGIMPVTPLGLMYPSDRDAAKASWEFMYGPSLLVCPVTDPDADCVTVYLPKGNDWYDFASEKRYHGGQYIKYPVDIDTIPIFVKSGSIIPLAPEVMSTAELIDKEYELRIYTGDDCKFTLYDDNGLDYGYERGEYTKVKYSYSDADMSLTEETDGIADYKHNVKIRYIK